MSLDKAIRHKKEKREPYRGSASFDQSCRHGGGCPACISNRTYRNEKRLESAKDKERQE